MIVPAQVGAAYVVVPGEKLKTLCTVTKEKQNPTSSAKSWLQVSQYQIKNLFRMSPTGFFVSAGLKLST